MRMKASLLFCAALGLLTVGCRKQAIEANAPAEEQKTTLRTFPARGVVRQLEPDGLTVVIEHEAISNYMAAMTMPFKTRQTNELSGLCQGDEISFRLLVGDHESWIDRVVKTGRISAAQARPSDQVTNDVASRSSRHPLLDYPFTNELGQTIRLNDFRGQALAITFFFTRCPIPDFCPRLSKNFEEASRKLSVLPDAPTNWHFLSVTFDSEFDTPAVLKAYGERYHYDPRNWSFLTGPADKIAELARESDVKFERDGSFYNHNFRTLIVNPAGLLQASIPIGGDLSDAIVREMLKAAVTTAATNQGGVAE